MATFPIERMNEAEAFNFTDAVLRYIARRQPQETPSTVDKVPLGHDTWWHRGKPQELHLAPREGKIANPGRHWYNRLGMREAPAGPRNDVFMTIKMLTLFPNIYSESK